jgi:hypothetical protein
MEIRLRSTGEVMLEDQFRRYQKENGGPTWDRTTDEVLEALGADVVFEGAQATGGTVYQYSMRAGVEQVDGKWYSKYILGPVFANTEDATAVEQEAAYKAQKDAEFAANARNQRDTLLTQTDWTQVADAPVDKAAWAAYRQALRDVPQQAGFPTTITWPEKP